MKRIGLTGGIASGKTMVSDYLQSLGAPVIDADQISRRITERGNPVLQEIAGVFGSDCLDENGELRRKKLGEIIFGDEDKRRRLNGILHPKIYAEMEREIHAHEAAGEAAVVLSIPLLVEGRSRDMTDEIWVVALDPQSQIRRLMDRDGIGEEAARLRLAAQSSLDEKLAKADKVIDNNGSREWTKTQTKALWEEVAADTLSGAGQVKRLDI